jgi:alkyl hydroperoxide reductase subunit AhpC
LKKIIKEIFFNNIGLTCNFAEIIRKIASVRLVDRALTHSIINAYEPGFQRNFAPGKKLLRPRETAKARVFCGR